MSESPVRYSIPLSFAQEGLERLYSRSAITELAPISTGFANSIFQFRRDGVPLVLRMPPRSTPRLAQEAELIRTLHARDIPVPLVTEYDSTYQNPLRHPFMVMQRLEGRNLFEAIENQEEREAGSLMEEIAETLSRIHSIDSTGLNVPKFPTLQSYLDAGLSMIKQFAKLGNARNFGAFEKWFQQTRPEEKSFNRAFIHNDFHGYNIMVEGHHLSGILDWNDAVVAEAQVDAAIFSLLAQAAGRPELADRFTAEYAKASNRQLQELEFYVTAIAIQKFIQIPLQKRQMEHTGQREKAELLGFVMTKIERNMVDLIEQNTGLSTADLT